MKLPFNKTLCMQAQEQGLELNNLRDLGIKEINIEYSINLIDTFVNVLDYIGLHDKVTSTDLIGILNGEKTMPIKRKRK